MGGLSGCNKAKVACWAAAAVGLLWGGPINYYEVKGSTGGCPERLQRLLGAGQPKLTYKGTFNIPNRTMVHCFREFKAGERSVNPPGCFGSQL